MVIEIVAAEADGGLQADSLWVMSVIKQVADVSTVSEVRASLMCGQYQTHKHVNNEQLAYELQVQYLLVMPLCHAINKAANPPDFHGSLPILRSMLRLYDLTMQTPNFSHVR